MRIGERTLLLSATDLANHLACRHLTELNRLAAIGEVKKPVRKDAVVETLIERGKQHEADYVEQLKLQGNSVHVIEEPYSDGAQAETLGAMQRGVDVVVQGSLRNGNWGGFPDLLVKVDTPSDLGSWSYEVADTKLTVNTRAGTILQLCLYSELVAEIQGLSPRRMAVVKPERSGNGKFVVEPFRVDDFMAYFRMVKRNLEQFVENPAGTPYPDPVVHCDVCNWWSHCNERRRKDDHLTFVAGIQKLQVNELNRQGIPTLTQFASVDEPLPDRPERGSIDSYQRVHKQARIQLEGKKSGKPEYEFLEIVPQTKEGENERGFLRLPEPDPGDVFFDIEGDPHAPGGGLEYLLGWVDGELAEPQYECLWALDRQAEKQAFEQFIDFLMERWAKHPGMHVYHFAPYEPSAMKRLSTRHRTREIETDRLLRGQRFVDLYAVTRQGIRASVESYSIKKLEAFYGYERLEDLEDARHALNRVERALELGLPADEFQEADKQVVLEYNKDDCISTLALRNWLESLRRELVASGTDVPRPLLRDGERKDIEDRAADIAEVYDALVKDVPEEDRSEDEQARWLLANLLEYFHREAKCDWWEYHRLRQLDQFSLLRERNAIAGLEFIEEVPTTGRSKNKTHRYRFEQQFVTIEEGDNLYEVTTEDKSPAENRMGTVVGIDLNELTIDIRKTGKTNEVHPGHVFVHSYFDAKPMPESLLDFARSVARTSDRGRAIHSARYDLLAKRPPRLKTLSLPMETTAQESAELIVSDLDNSVLAIQGPPGTGKTHVGSEVIVSLANKGKRVGITAVSHQVIAGLLDRVHRASGGSVAIAHKVSSKKNTAEDCKVISSNKQVEKALDDRYVVGGTGWTWSDERLEQQLDYLFIDEAGQMSLAMALAAGRAAKNIVLLGDPQQLEQPQKGAHPEGSEIAALNHLIDGRATVASDRGLFLDVTWRLPPSVCQFTSEQYYDSRLGSRSGLEGQVIAGPSSFAGNGLHFAPVLHSGNENYSDEEVDVIRHHIDSFVDGRHSWIDVDGKQSRLNLEDILVVAPYNAQVSRLKKALPDGARVGTVDLFQGKEAPVVIYSLTSSSVDDAPRGLEFLFSPNRLNVATSRARCVAILVGSPKLFQPDCKSPKQMAWANGMCRFLELCQTDPLISDNRNSLTFP